MKPLIIVTGASKGIGYEISKQLLRDGYGVHAIARKKTLLEQLRYDLKHFGNVSYSLVDISNVNEVNNFTKNWSQKIYGLINNAGHWKEEYLEELNSDCLIEILNLNLIGLYKITKGLLPYITSPGRIINISSQLGSEGREGMGAYCASKHAVLGLTKCWALELSKKGILVNAVSPGWVMTQSNINDFKKKTIESNVKMQTLINDIAEKLMLRRFIEPREIASVVTFLVSKEASGISGQNFVIR